MNDITGGAIFNIKLGSQNVRLSNNLFNPTEQENINQCVDCEGSSSSACAELEVGTIKFWVLIRDMDSD